MVYHSHRNSIKYKTLNVDIPRSSTKEYGVKDFIKGIKVFEITARNWSGISSGRSKIAYIKALICAIAGKLSKEEIIELRDRYISLCHVLDGSDELNYVNVLIDTCTKDDMDSLTDCFNNMEIPKRKN